MPKNEYSRVEQTHAVKLRHNDLGDLGEGTLTFGKSYARVTLERSMLGDKQEIDQVTATAANGSIYTLCICDVSHETLFANYIVEADIADLAFKEIVVRCDDVSEWFLQNQRIEGTVGQQLTWSNVSKPLSISVATEENNFSLTSEYCKGRKTSGEDTTIHEHIEFCFSKTTSAFGLTDIKTKSHELTTLLSILLGYSVTPMSVYVSLPNERRCQVHFLLPEPSDQAAKNSWGRLRFFTQKVTLEDQWQAIFDGYYKSKYRKPCWTYLAGMLRFDGFWEHQLFGYVSILDRYVTLHTKSAENLTATKQSPPEERLSKFQGEINRRIPALTNDQITELRAIASDVFAKNDSFATKYAYAIFKTDADILKIIALTKNDFEEIKKIRNRIAHGDDTGIQGDLTRTFQQINKIALLLTYWAFRDLGIPTQSFMKFLNRTHHSLVRQAQIDEVHLARMTGLAEFFPVTKKQLDELKRIQGIHVFSCFVRDKRGAITFSEKYTALSKSYYLKPPEGQSKPLFGVDAPLCKYVHQGYFEFEDERLNVKSMWIIDTDS